MSADFLCRVLSPMEPESWPAPFDSDDHLFQPKWDGIRLLAFVRRRGRRYFRLQNRRGRDRTDRYPEIEAVAGQLRADEAVLDGEAVVVEGGRTSFPPVLRRDRGAPGAAGPPVSYLVFDLLYLDGMDLRSRPLEERAARLAERLDDRGPAAFLTESYESGTALYRAVREQGGEGIVAKLRRSPYRPGRQKAWLKVKNWRILDCRVGGYATNGGRTSLLLGIPQDGRLVYVGSVNAGRQGPRLERELAARGRAASPFLPPPRRPARWVEPELTARVRFLEWSEDLKLRHASLEGWEVGDWPPG